MSEAITLEAQIRTDLGKGASRRLRHANQTPAIIYGGETAPVSITLAHNKLFKAQEQESFYSQVLTISVDGKEEKVIVKAMQRHSHKPVVNHVDFLRVDESHVLHTSVPVHFINEDASAAVKSGGVVAHHANEIEVACLPSALPEFIEVDVANLEVGQTVHLSDVTFPAGVTSVELAKGESHDLAVVSIAAPKGASTEEASEEEAAE
ncbi:50S ribosomal protein L25/general stress protein Ctc [Psychrobium sp. 1_MG-2023]|uniref:50S ribosomal protein L25/general stress protein Ctc n=1 Tax=Psychrobium sp. 1_MG-2023 TaxID=3062624 RepID=UPI000C327D04|nr:50S ribosomal protein L25/general stress protein Ctc [Psychrobium sp. 1_MG-2023]MDP2560949.1 50S ribosomal protein L25/general stress protein Ctc [Psychrobium sp. 1_MG-2023]PKF56021.1 50S ribosomal protein L25 [Alteromonadales bacterium alter-6D02]